MLDPDLRPERWRSTSAAVEVVGSCVPGAYLVKCNAREALALTGELEVEAAAAALLAAIGGEPAPEYVPSVPELVQRASSGRPR